MSIALLLCFLAAGLAAFYFRGNLGLGSADASPSGRQAVSRAEQGIDERAEEESTPRNPDPDPIAVADSTSAIANTNPGINPTNDAIVPDGKEGRGVKENSDTKLRILVPAYFHPSGPGLSLWSRLFEAANKVPLVVVVNPDSGPGLEVDRDYTVALDLAVRRNVVTIGYVDTTHAKRALEDVKADIKTWTRMYPQIGGFFFDGQAPEAANVGYYENISTFARENVKDATIVTNPGRICDEGFFENKVADSVVLFEGPDGFANFTLPLWSANHNRKMFGAFPYGIMSQDAMRVCVGEADKKGLGYIYVTDLKGDKTWFSLPSYWDAEVRSVQNVNHHQLP